MVRIPTSDPQAALKFCQMLAEKLTSKVIFDGEEKDTLQETRPAISVVISVYDKEDNLPVLYEKLTKVLMEVEPLYELIFVDDGSRTGVQTFLKDWRKSINM